MKPTHRDDIADESHQSSVPTSVPQPPPRRFNGGLLGALLLLVVILWGAHYAINHYRRPGSMSVIEAQAMDMAVMKPPVGAVPVEVVKAIRAAVQSKVSYTGSAVAFNQTNIAARVSGRIVALPVYAGDRVKAGQLLVRLDSDELRAKEQGARYARDAAEQDRLVAADEAEAARAARVQAGTETDRSQAMIQEADAEVIHGQASVQEAHIMVDAQRSNVAQAQSALVATREDKRMAQADLEATQAALATANGEVESAQATVQSTQARLPQAQAEVTSAQAEVQLAQDKRDRSAQLLKQGAISKEEFQTDETAFRDAQAKVNSAQSRVDEVQSDIAAAQAKVRQAQAGVKEAAARISTARAAVARASANITAAEGKVKQSQAELAAAQIKVTHAHADTDAAKARLAQARAGVANAHAIAQGANANIGKALHQAQRASTMTAQADAQLSEAAIVRGYTEIRATTDGVVMSRLASPGTLVEPGTPILQIAQINPLRFQANVAQSDLAAIQVGMPVTIRSTSQTDKTLQARVSAVFPTADAQSRTGIVEALAPNGDGRFKPGEFISMEIETSANKGPGMGGVRVPVDALVQQPDEADENSGQVVALHSQSMVWVMQRSSSQKPAVYTCTMHPQIRESRPGLCPICKMQLTPLESGGQFRARLVPVKTGASNGDFVEIVSGVSDGAQVIVRGYDDLKNGDAVVPSHFGADSPLELPAVNTSGTTEANGVKATGKVAANRSTGIRVTVNEKGFSPATFELKKGVPTAITFLRTTDATCATELVWPDYGIKRALPLNTPVTLTITPKKNGLPQTTFACGMNMFKGTVTLR